MSDQATILIGAPLLQVFGRMGCGGLILSTRGHVLAANAEAHRILHNTLGIGDENLSLLGGSGRSIIKRLLALSQTRIQLEGGNWLIAQRHDQRPLIMSTIIVMAPGEEDSHTVLILIDLDQTPRPHTTALESVFGLTATEAKLAALLAGGATVAEAATVHKVSVATVRTQLASIFSKTHTNRQTELITLVMRLSALV